MKPKDAFTDFIAEFLQLAGEAKIVDDHRKDEGLGKVSILDQAVSTSVKNDDDMTDLLSPMSFTTLVQITVKNQSFQLHVLVDTGADIYAVIHPRAVDQLGDLFKLPSMLQTSIMSLVGDSNATFERMVDSCTKNAHMINVIQSSFLLFSS